MIFDQIVHFLNVYKQNTNLLIHFWVKKNSMSFHDDSLNQLFHHKISLKKRCWFCSPFWSPKLFIIKGLKRKNPESKVEGTFKIRGEFSRHNVGWSRPLRSGLCRTHQRLNKKLASRMPSVFFGVSKPIHPLDCVSCVKLTRDVWFSRKFRAGQALVDVQAVLMQAFARLAKRPHKWTNPCYTSATCPTAWIAKTSRRCFSMPAP